MPNLVGTGLNQVPTNGMLGGLAYQSPDHASIKDLDLKNLSQINSEIADTAVDIFIYDTSKDSDGGAWRHRTTHTSWYNETLNTATRGSRREFPAVAVIVVEQYKVTIYDGDDPDLPMWIEWTDCNLGSNKPITAVSAINGIVVWSTSDAIANGAAVYEWNFIAETEYIFGWYGITRKTNVNPFTVRDSDRASLYSDDTSRGGILNAICNDVAMTVLPNAPIDSATGLPIPTIAVATDGGVSVIKDDGTVVDVTAQSGGSYNATAWIDITKNNRLIFEQDSANRAVFCIPIPSADRITATNDGSITDKVVMKYYSSGTHIPYPCYFGAAIDDGISLGDGDNQALVGSNGELTILYPDFNAPANGKVAYITSDYNTGWMHGDIKGAFLSDTDATNVTGTELVSNGTFDSDVSGWTSGNATISYQSNQAKVTSNSGGYSSAYQAITTVIGQRYTVSANVNNVSSLNGSSIYIQNGTVLGPAIAITNSIANGSSGVVEKTFTATATTTYIHLTAQSYAANEYALFDNVTVRIAEEDRSVNDNGLQVFGTVTKSAVATGAELVAYSGFSASNYLLQPYNSDLDVGTGDISVIGWFKSSNSAGGYFFERMDPARTGNRLRGYITNSTYQFLISASAGVIISNQNYLDGTWHFYSGIKRGSVMYLYVDGRLLGSADVGTNSITNTSANLSFGIRSDAASHFQDGNMALWRVSASAPTDEQIKKIYEDEKVLFQENAACALYGSSDAVTALAYDEDLQLLHVGTSSGRSDFQGLRRINNTTTAVTTAMSASNGLVAEQ